MTYREAYIKKVLEYAKEHHIIGFTEAREQMEAEEAQEHFESLRKMGIGCCDLIQLHSKG